MSTSTAIGKPRHLIRFDLYCIVFVGGALGTALRYAFSVLPASGTFHIGTFAANMLAAFCYAGLSAYLPAAAWIGSRLKESMNRGLGMGLCGGLSTMSTLAVEEFTALRDDGTAGMIGYCLITFACGLALAWLGASLGYALAKSHAANASRENNDDNDGNFGEESAR